ANMVGTARWGSLRQFGEVAVPPARPAVAVLPCLLLAACTGGNDQAAGPDVSAGGSLRLTVASVPLNCEAVPGAPDGCQVGGSGGADGLGKVRGSPPARLALPRPGGCREAAIAGSLNGGAWSAPLNGKGEWCGHTASFPLQPSRGAPGAGAR